MAELCGISPDTLTWTTRWYLRDDTLRAANAAIVNLHHHHPLAQVWGGGTLSSSDGLRLPIRGKSLTARRLSRYFVDQGGTSYTHVSDQHTTYGTQIIVTTDRDAAYVLDEILGNTTDLPIAEHTTDTHGQTLLTFALFDLVGLRLSPRIAKLAQQRLWRPPPTQQIPTVATRRPPPRSPRTDSPNRPTLGRPAPNRMVTQNRPRLRVASNHPPPSRHPPASTRQSPPRIRKTTTDQPRPPLVYRRNLPPPHRPPTQPRRIPQRPTPLPILRPPRRDHPSRHPRPNRPSTLPHPPHQRLRPLEHPLPRSRHHRPPKRRPQPRRPRPRPHQPRPIRPHQPIRHLHVRHQDHPQPPKPPTPQTTTPPLDEAQPSHLAPMISEPRPRRRSGWAQRRAGRAAWERPAPAPRAVR